MICPECHKELTNQKDCCGHDCEVMSCIKCKRILPYKDYVYGMSGNALICKGCYQLKKEKRKLITAIAPGFFRQVVLSLNDDKLLVLLKEYKNGEFTVEKEKKKPMTSGSKTSE